MRYLIYQLNWISGYGYGPEDIANQNNSRIEPSCFVENERILGYMHGELDLSLISAYQPEILTQNEALLFAKNLNETAYLLDDGTIAFDVSDLYKN